MQHFEDLSKKRKKFLTDNISKGEIYFRISEKIDGMSATMFFTPNNVYLQTRSGKIFSDPKQFNDKIYYMREIRDAYIEFKKNYNQILGYECEIEDNYDYFYKHVNKSKLFKIEGEFLPKSQWNIINYENYFNASFHTAFLTYNKFINFSHSQNILYCNGCQIFSELELEDKNILLKSLSANFGIGYHDEIEGFVVEVKDNNTEKTLFSFKVVDKNDFTKKKINDWALIDDMKKIRKEHFSDKKLAHKLLDEVQDKLRSYVFYSPKKQLDSHEELLLSRDILDEKIVY